MRVQVPPPAPLLFGSCQTNFEAEPNTCIRLANHWTRKKANAIGFHTLRGASVFLRSIVAFAINGFAQKPTLSITP
jgi:hypothetical protein